MIMLALFGMGVLIIDLLLPAEWKRANAWTALIGVGVLGGCGLQDPTGGSLCRGAWCSGGSFVGFAGSTGDGSLCDLLLLSVPGWARRSPS